MVLFDQRGGGKSTPPAEIHNNTSQHLVADIEALREHLQISKWHLVFGGSWGSTLSLLYSEAHPERVNSLILRGIFTLTKAELEWSFAPHGLGAGRIFPDAYDDFITFLPESDRSDPMNSYYKLLTPNNDTETRLRAAREWNLWELKGSNLTCTEETLKRVDDCRWSLAHAVIEAHYFTHGAWMEDGQLIRKENVDRIRHIPSTCGNQKDARIDLPYFFFLAGASIVCHLQS